MTGLTHGETTARGTSRGFKVGVGGNVPLVGGGNLDVERAPTETGSESFERAYDPFWANALEFLEALNERGLVRNEIGKAAIGQFVLLKGSLIVADLQMVRSFWNLSSLKDLIRGGMKDVQPAEAGNRQERRAAGAKKLKQKPRKESSEADMMMELLPLMPHTGQAYLINDTDAVWAPISLESIVVPIPDLILKHGAKIAGEWAMLGILDARPNEPGNELSPSEAIRLGMSGNSGNISSALMSSMGPLVKKPLGRPDGLYGLTPLMIFREIQS